MQRSVDEVLARPDLKLPVLVMVPLKHINATIATNALRPFFASTGAPGGGGTLTLGNVGNSSAMLLTGMQDQVAQAIRLIRGCDVPPPPEQMEQAANSGERIQQLERRVKALEDKLAESAKPK
jgi:hypothetical protein